MQNPYHEQDAYDQKLCDMVDADTAAYESICEQLLNGGIADYYNNKREYKQLYLDKIKEDYADVIEEGMSIRDVIEAEAKRIVESIRG